MNLVNLNLSTIEAFNDVFPLVSLYLNPREHCQTARVCKQFYTIMIDIWQKQQYDTLQNRKWIAGFYTQSENHLNENIEQLKRMVKQNILGSFTPRNNIINESYVALLRFQINSAVDTVFNKHNKELRSSLKNIIIQSLINCFSIAQIKKFIEWEKDPFMCSLLQKIALSKQSRDMTKIKSLIDELQLKIEEQFKQLSIAPNQEESVQELPAQEKDKITNQPINIDASERQEDTPENRLWFANVLLEKGYLAQQIQTLKEAIMTSHLYRIANEKKIELNAVPETTRCEVKQVVNKVCNNNLERIQSFFKKTAIETIVKTHPPIEIQKMITMHEDPISHTVMTNRQQIMHYSFTNSAKLSKDIMKKVFEEMGYPPNAIKTIFGEKN